MDRPLHRGVFGLLRPLFGIPTAHMFCMYSHISFVNEWRCVASRHPVGCQLALAPIPVGRAHAPLNTPPPPPPGVRHNKRPETAWWQSQASPNTSVPGSASALADPPPSVIRLLRSPSLAHHNPCSRLSFPLSLSLPSSPHRPTPSSRSSTLSTLGRHSPSLHA